MSELNGSAGLDWENDLPAEDRINRPILRGELSYSGLRKLMRALRMAKAGENTGVSLALWELQPSDVQPALEILGSLTVGVYAVGAKHTVDHMERLEMTHLELGLGKEGGRDKTAP